MRHCSSCFGHKMGLIPCKPAGWAAEGGWERCKLWAGDKHGVIPAFWLSAVEYFSVFCVDPSVLPPGREAGVQGVAVHPPLELSVGKWTQAALLGQVLWFGYRAVASGDLMLALLQPQCQAWENLHFL